MGKRSAVFLINGVWKTQAFPEFFLASQVGASGKESTSRAGDVRDSGLIPGSARSHRKGHWNPLQYSCLENPLTGAWWATVHGVLKSRTQLKRLSMHTRLLAWALDRHGFRVSQVETVIAVLQRDYNSTRCYIRVCRAVSLWSIFSGCCPSFNINDLLIMMTHKVMWHSDKAW